MKLKARTMLIDTCRMGTYLVCHTKAAALHLDELFQKRAPYLNEQTPPFIQLIFKDDPYTHGIIKHRYEKCKRLCSSYLYEHEDETKALKEFAFSLRTLLQYSEYKHMIRELERNNSPYKDGEQFIQYAEELIRTQNGSEQYDFYPYLMLFTFIRSLREVSRYLSKLDIKRSNYFDETLEFTAQADLLDGYFSILQKGLYWVTADELYDKYVTDAPFANFLNKHQLTVTQFTKYFFYKYCVDHTVSLDAFNDTIWEQHFQTAPIAMSRLIGATTEEHVHNFTYVYELFHINTTELIRFASVTTEQLTSLLLLYYGSIHAEQREQWLAQTVNNEVYTTQIAHELYGWLTQVTVAQYIEASTAIYESISKKQVAKVEVKKMMKAAPKPVADSFYKKELAIVQKQHEQLQAELSIVQAQVAKLEKQLAETNSQLFRVQEENEELSELLDAVEEAPPIPAEAKKLVAHMQTLLGQLHEELHVKLEEEVVTQTIFDEIAPLKIAIVGGHQRYHSQLKRKFKQELLTISPDKMNFNVQQLLQYDVVVFSTDYANHSLYERAYDFMKKSNAKSRALVLSTQPNARRLAEQIMEFYSKLLD